MEIERLEMGGRAIALVAGKAKIGRVAIHDGTHAVAHHLGDDGRRRDGDAAAIPADKGDAGAGQARGHVAAIDQHAVGHTGQGAHGAGHGGQRGAADIERQNVGRRGADNGDIGHGQDFLDVEPFLQA